MQAGTSVCPPLIEQRSATTAGALDGRGGLDRRLTGAVRLWAYMAQVNL